MVSLGFRKKTNCENKKNSNCDYKKRQKTKTIGKAVAHRTNTTTKFLTKKHRIHNLTDMK